MGSSTGGDDGVLSYLEGPPEGRGRRCKGMFTRGEGVPCVKAYTGSEGPGPGGVRARGAGAVV